MSREQESRVISKQRIKTHGKSFYLLTAIAAFVATSIRFMTVNAVVLPGLATGPEGQHLPPANTNGVYDGVLMKMSDLSYVNLDKYAGRTLGDLAQGDAGPTDINHEIQTVNSLYWHLSTNQATQLYFSDLNNWRIVAVKDAEATDGFYAVAFQQGNTVVIAYRGTDNVQDVMSDADIYLKIQGEVQQLSLAKKFAAEVQQSLPGTVTHFIFTGHSIGGWLAQQMYLSELRTQRPTSGISFQATVFNSIGTEFQPTKNHSLTVRDYHFQGDIFSHFGTSLGQEIEVLNPRSNESIYDKHQLFNFYQYFYPANR